jgi:hypothetical protein
LPVFTPPSGFDPGFPANLLNPFREEKHLSTFRTEEEIAFLKIKFPLWQIYISLALSSLFPQKSCTAVNFIK